MPEDPAQNNCFSVLEQHSCIQGPEKRAEYNIKDNLVRFSCGVEDVEDIWQDLDQALRNAVGSKQRRPSSDVSSNGQAVPVPL